MAQLGQRFDATAHDTTQRTEYEELPNGVYALEITASDVAATKSGTGTILKITNDVLEPEEYKGRKLFATYNIENQNSQAQEIGQRQFASLCRAVGVLDCEDSEQLHFIRYVAKVGLGKPSKDGQYPARAEIKSYFYPDEGALPVPAVDTAQPPKAANDNRPAARPAAAANDNRPQAKPAGSRPWDRKAA